MALEVIKTHEWAKLILFWRTHLDCFIRDYFKVDLKPDQQVLARAIGNCTMIDIVQNRGAGKTWLIAICAIALGVLYPGSLIAVASGTAEQATLILQKVEDKFITNPNVLREIDCAKRRPVVISRSKSECYLKNGSKIRSYSVGTLRGQRAKIVLIDEAPEVKKSDLDAIIGPIRNEKRQICFDYNLPDFNSKMISITSACLKSNYFYEDFVGKLRAMRGGDHTRFAVALDYQAAIDMGITDKEFFDEERRRMPEPKFQMEYGSMFIGEEAGSWFPYDIIEPCRTLTQVETCAPRGSQAQYVIGLDLATSTANIADNAVMTIIKLVEHEDGSFGKKVVNIRSWHGKKLDFLAGEVRRALVRFPNTIRVVFDHRGLGDALPQFLNIPWTDPETGKEYPPLVLDDGKSIITGAQPILHSVIATQGINQGLATSLRVAFEQHSIELPVSSRRIINGHIVKTDDETDMLDEDEETELPDGRPISQVAKRKLSAFETAIFIEADAMQIELGQIVARVSAAGNYVYDTAKTNQHKDRYSSIAMAVWYISQQEDKRKKKIERAKRNTCVGIVSSF